MPTSNAPFYNEIGALLTTDITFKLAREALPIIQAYLFYPYVAGVRIEPTSYKEIFENDVSQQVIVSPDGKLYRTDNVAPKPRRWQITGYIPPEPWEITCLSPLLMPSLMDKKQKLRDARMQRIAVPFTPLNKDGAFSQITSAGDLLNTAFGEISVVIQSMEFSTLPEVANRVPISITLIEIPVLNQTGTQVARPQGAPTAGSAFGDGLNLGQSNTIQSTTKPTVPGLFGPTR